MADDSPVMSWPSAHSGWKWILNEEVRECYYPECTVIIMPMDLVLKNETTYYCPSCASANTFLKSPPPEAVAFAAALKEKPVGTEGDKTYVASSSGIYWVITNAVHKCKVDAHIKDAEGEYPIHQIPAGMIAAQYNVSTFWCEDCTMKLGYNAPVPEELRIKQKAMSAKFGSVRTITSFSYKSGTIAKDAAQKLYTFDIRKTIRNPWRHPALKKLDGRDQQIKDFILRCPQSAKVLTTIETYVQAGMNVAIGCQGGKHRSVAVAELVAERCRAAGMSVKVVHRDLKVKGKK